MFAFFLNKSKWLNPKKATLANISKNILESLLKVDQLFGCTAETRLKHTNSEIHTYKQTLKALRTAYAVNMTDYNNQPTKYC